MQLQIHELVWLRSTLDRVNAQRGACYETIVAQCAMQLGDEGQRHMYLVAVATLCKPWWWRGQGASAKRVTVRPEQLQVLKDATELLKRYDPTGVIRATSPLFVTPKNRNSVAELNAFMVMEGIGCPIK